MIKITQHRPAYFSGYENEVCEVETLEELLAIPFVKRFSDGKGFIRYSLTSYKKAFGGRDFDLMAEYTNSHWVVGRLEGNVKSLKLPKFYSHETLLEVADMTFEPKKGCKEYLWTSSHNTSLPAGSKFYYNGRLVEVVEATSFWRTKDEETGRDYVNERVLVKEVKE